MKTIATASYDFESLIKGGCVYVDKTLFSLYAYKGGSRPMTLIGINFSANKRNIDEPLIERL